MRFSLSPAALSRLSILAAFALGVGGTGLAVEAPKFARLLAAYKAVSGAYVRPVDDAKLEQAAIAAMVASLDPHSEYLEGASLRGMATIIDGSYAGVGVSLMLDNGALKVITPMRGGPAERAGIRPGDIVTRVDGEPVPTGSLEQAVSRIRGKEGTSVRLTLQRVGSESLELTLVREKVKTEPVSWKLVDGVGVITLSEFSRTAGADVANAVTDMHTRAGGGFFGLVIDLRSNPGGSVDGAVAFADLFLKDGVILVQQGRTAKDRVEYKAESSYKGDLADGLPIVVLVNGGSASAAEILAGTLQDHRRAKVLGERTFGKGSIQTLIYLDPDHAVKVTTALYYLPSGRPVQARGVVPDVAVPQLSDPDYKSRAATRVRESDVKGHLAIDDKEPIPEPAEQPRFSDTAETLKARGITDFQLDYAVRAVRLQAGVPLRVAARPSAGRGTLR